MRTGGPTGLLPCFSSWGVLASSRLASTGPFHSAVAEPCRAGRGGRLTPGHGFRRLGPAGCPAKHASPLRYLVAIGLFPHLQNGAAMWPYLTGEGGGWHVGW